MFGDRSGVINAPERAGRPGRQEPSSADGVVFTFPGQGSQRTEAGRAWQGTQAWRLVERAGEVLGRDVGCLLLDADAETLRDTSNAQIAVFVSSMLALSELEDAGVAPELCMGHSVGEYAALVAAGVISFDDALRTVSSRAAAMRSAAADRPGTMAAVLGLEVAGVEEACGVHDEAWVANDNSPEQVAIAGSEEGVEAATVRARELGARRVLALPVAGAFHTPLMAAAFGPLAQALHSVELTDSALPVIANVDADVHRRGSAWRDLLLEQLCRPVRWRQSLERAAASLGATRPCFVEVGQGDVLSGLARRTVTDASTCAVSTPDAVATLAERIGPRPSRADACTVGEWVGLSERLITSPTLGGFHPADPEDDFEGTVVGPGTVIGKVADQEVRAFCGGWLTRMLVMPGERVKPGQPVAVVRSI